jgi:hypothetical protein
MELTTMPYPFFRSTQTDRVSTAYAMRRLAGVPEQYVRKMPAELMTPMTRVDGVQVCVLTSDGARAFWKNPHTNTPMRVIAVCPTCEKVVPASRLNQHYRVHLKEG